MAVVRRSAPEVRLLARMMRAEAEGELEQGMLMVGNVGINRVRNNCSDFKNIRSIKQMIYQPTFPGSRYYAFEAVGKPTFYQKVRNRDIRLAEQAIDGRRLWPATTALWYMNPKYINRNVCVTPSWPTANTQYVGRYKAHCFYAATYKECPTFR
ncbi:cell wall hydrolase [Tumebacillus permanentifrigoris]|uniref:N-acetylmuramoyl-L-alanine amidase n=1 Tax=Tumebacillus permanentifrigoris TaxID=378543 RepID=A0A316DED5_9BACL|nr:cell wall hydrolase [Tumebacillus permanentifrigoris]PWK16561.1 N-acetylmuramoyl-L-alanine amidase [Tumebacillus permanentifrigoris]